MYNDIASVKSKKLTDVEKNEIWAYICKKYPEENVKVRDLLYRRTIRRIELMIEEDN